MTITYNDALVQNYPTITFSSTGIGGDYEDIVHISGPALPAQAELDAVIVTMIKAEMWRLIQVERDRRTMAGVNVAGNWFHSDTPSRIQQIGLVIMGAGLPSGIMWKTMAGSFIEMTPSLAGQIFQSVAAKDIAIFTTAEQHRFLMNASSSPATYNYLTGSPAWPAVYGE